MERVTDKLTEANAVNRETDYRLWDAIDAVIDSGRVNADETVYIEKAVPEAEWDRIALGSIEGILSYGVDPQVAAWFTAQGVTF